MGMMSKQLNALSAGFSLHTRSGACYYWVGLDFFLQNRRFKANLSTSKNG